MHFNYLFSTIFIIIIPLVFFICGGNCFCYSNTGECQTKECLRQCPFPSNADNNNNNNSLTDSSDLCIYVETDEIKGLYIDCVNFTIMPNYTDYCQEGHFCRGYIRNGYKVCCCKGNKCNSPGNAVSFKDITLDKKVYPILVPPSLYEELIPQAIARPLMEIWVIVIVCAVFLSTVIVFVVCLIYRFKFSPPLRFQGPVSHEMIDAMDDYSHHGGYHILPNFLTTCAGRDHCYCAGHQQHSQEVSNNHRWHHDHGVESICESLPLRTTMPPPPSSLSHPYSNPYSSYPPSCINVNNLAPIISSNNNNRIPTLYDSILGPPNSWDSPVAISLVGGPEGTTAIVGRNVTHLNNVLPNNIEDFVYSNQEMQTIHRTNRLNCQQNWWEIVSECFVKGRMSEIYRVVPSSSSSFSSSSSSSTTSDSATTPSKSAILKVIFNEKIGQTELNTYLLLQRIEKHKHICHLLDHDRLTISIMKKSVYWLIIENCIHGSIHDYLSSSHVDVNANDDNDDVNNQLCTLSWNECCRILHGIASGLTYLHSDCPQIDKSPIVHRDIKSRNILLKGNLVPCICDFGFALSLHSSFCYGEIREEVGTWRYMAPELLQNIIQRDRTAFLSQDVYSLSLVMWEVLSRCRELPLSKSSPSESIEFTSVHNLGQYKPPFEKELLERCNSISATAVNMKSIVGQYQCRPDFRPEWKQHNETNMLCELMEDCWEANYEARVTADCVLERLTELVQSQKDN